MTLLSLSTAMVLARKDSRRSKDIKQFTGEGIQWERKNPVLTAVEEPDDAIPVPDQKGRRMSAEGTIMKGIEFLFDEKGKPRAVVIDLRKHGRLWEDFYDHMIVQSRRKEPRVPWETVKANLRRRKVVQ